MHKYSSVNFFVEWISIWYSYQGQLTLLWISPIQDFGHFMWINVLSRAGIKVVRLSWKGSQSISSFNFCLNSWRVWFRLCGDKAIVVFISFTKEHAFDSTILCAIPYLCLRNLKQLNNWWLLCNCMIQPTLQFWEPCKKRSQQVQFSVNSPLFILSSISTAGIIWLLILEYSPRCSADLSACLPVISDILVVGVL